MPEFVTEEQNLTLIRDIEMREVIDAVKTLATWKAPGIDGVPAEFFMGVINDIKGDLWHLVNEISRNSHYVDHSIPVELVFYPSKAIYHILPTIDPYPF